MATKYNDFNENLKDGNRVEDLFKENFKEILVPQIEQILYEENPELQHKGIDFKFNYKTITGTSVDVKVRDSSCLIYSDILLEVESPTGKDKSGWLWKEDTTIVAYVWWSDGSKKKFSRGYLLLMLDIREWLATLDFLNKYTSRIAYSKRGIFTWATKNIPIPISDFPLNCISKINMDKIFPSRTGKLTDFLKK